MKLTIFTPTYNRAYTLGRLYNSLKEQKKYEFEWIIVDDASTDNTTELVNDFKADCNEFDIIYVKQTHGGKHRAINKALDIAKGEFFFIVDSDDYLTDDAVEKILLWIESIKNNKNIAGVSGLRVYPDNSAIGGMPKCNENSYIDASNFERGKYNLLGDKAEIYKTDIMRKNKFPEFEGEYFVTEGVCWNAIAAEGYKVRWFNTPIYVCDYLEDGLTKTGANSIEGHRKNIKGYCYFIKQSIKIFPLKEKLIYINSYSSVMKQLNITSSDAANYINMKYIPYISLKGTSAVLLHLVKIKNKLKYKY